MMKRSITKNDILDPISFKTARPLLLTSIQALKKNRRIAIGPEMTLYFENHATLCWQIQEMLRVENGGDEQLQDEIEAYSPLIPQIHDDHSQELVASLMVEIENIERRNIMLKKLTSIENSIVMHIGQTSVVATPVDDVNRTAEDGKTSAVHFIKFVLPQENVSLFKDPKHPIVIESLHKNYPFKTELSTEQKIALTRDFD